MNELSSNKKFNKPDMPDVTTGHGLEYTLYISLILIVLVSLYLDVVNS